MAGFSFILLWAGLCSGVSTQGSAPSGVAQVTEAQAQSAEFWIRGVALDPEGTRADWLPRLSSADWLQVYDVFDAMQRCPEAAQWFCEHEKEALSAGLEHPRSAVRAAAWRVVRMGQGLGADCVDWSVGGGTSMGEERRAWRAAALSQAGLGSGVASDQAYRAILHEWANNGWELETSGQSEARAFAVLMGLNRTVPAPELWWQGPGADGAFRGLEARDLQWLVNPEVLVQLRDRARVRDVEVAFRVECLALAQAAFFDGTFGVETSIDWDAVGHGVQNPPLGFLGEETLWTGWYTFVTQLARLGSERLSAIFWDVAMHAEQRLSPEVVQAFGGVDSAVESYVRWAVESAPPGVSLDRVLPENRALQRLVWSALEGDWRPIPWGALEPWLRGHLGEESQELAISRLCEAAPSAERTGLLLEVVEHCSGESLRRVFRALASSSEGEAVGARLHRIWRDQDPQTRQSLLRELPNSPAWIAFEQDWLEDLRELGPCDLLVLEHLVWLPNAQRWTALLERDFGESLEARFEVWRRGEEPVSRDLARRAAALYRVQAGAPDGARPTMHENRLWAAALRRVEWICALPPESAEGVRFDFTKACIALLALEPDFVDWVKEHLVVLSTWPRRLRVEVAMQLPQESYVGANPELRAFVEGVAREDYPKLGVVLKERWLAQPARAGEWLVREAVNRRTPTTVRQIAMAGLASTGNVPVLLQILEEDTGVTGPQLALESLANLSLDGIDDALRQRWLRAKRAIQANGANREIETHLAAELMGTLVRRGALDTEELSEILERPFGMRSEQWVERLSGVATEMDWGPERRVIERIAQRGELSELLVQNPKWQTLDGRLLASLARIAWTAKDLEATHLLARWAEVALAGEPDANRWVVEDLNLGLLRFQVARARGDFGPVAWYCERFVQDLLRGGLRSSPAEALLGGFDLREGRHGLAWLCALRLQGLAMRAASAGDPDGAQGLLKQAGTYCGSSKRAQVQQERAARWVEDR